MMEVDITYFGNCLKVMPWAMPDKSLDAIVTDLPSGRTRNDWDSIIPLDKLWAEYKRIIKDNGVIILFGQDKFSAELMLSNRKMHRYNIIWEKTKATGHLNANRMPLRSHEDILVFYKKLPTYNPQKTTGHKPVNSYTKHTGDGSNYGKTKIGISGGGSTERHPRSIWTFSSDTQKSSLHPTQKPLLLLEEIVKTYTNEGDVVLDNAAGSGTLGKACSNLNRRYIMIENKRVHYDTILERMQG